MRKKFIIGGAGGIAVAIAVAVLSVNTFYGKSNDRDLAAGNAGSMAESSAELTYGDQAEVKKNLSFYARANRQNAGSDAEKEKLKELEAAANASSEEIKEEAAKSAQESSEKEAEAVQQAEEAKKEAESKAAQSAAQESKKEASREAAASARAYKAEEIRQESIRESIEESSREEESRQEESRKEESRKEESRQEEARKEESRQAAIRKALTRSALEQAEETSTHTDSFLSERMTDSYVSPYSNSQPEVSVANVPLDSELTSYIIETSKSYGVDPVITFAVMFQESSFNSRAVSKKGSIGLMQVHPAYNRARMARLGVTNLFDPHQNVLAGIDCLAEYVHAYNGDYTKVLTTYRYGNPNASNDYAERVLGSLSRFR